MTHSLGFFDSKKTGFTLIEILVVIGVFTVLMAISTQAVLLALRGSRKSQSQIAVKENLNLALSVIERQLHNADSVACPDVTTISYKDQNSSLATFTCQNLGESGYVASSSARLTTSEIAVTACSFSCSPGGSGLPASVAISLTAQDADSVGQEGAAVTADTQILLRTY